MIRRLLIAGTAAGALALAGATALPAQAHALPGLPGLPAGHTATFATSQSTNWSGYSEPLTQSGPYQSISATWTVPTATQHTAGQAESSATWVGIGGGCITSDCLVGDSTLVQAGTEQDVSAGGTASYYAWWEIVPVPSIQFSMPVTAGDVISASLTQTAPEVWNIVLTDLTTGHTGTATQTIPYPSDYTTAEFIEETPLSVGTSGTGLTNLPNLGTVGFSNAKVNGGPAGLVPADEMQLTDSNGNVIATPSAPDPTGTAFNDCTWATTCAAPLS
ncbi:MAG: G1 family glutamic endopeptidase [Acidimicrobiales bacterium]